MREIKFRVYEPLNKEMHYLDFALYKYNKGLNSHKFVLPLGKQGLQNPYTMMNLDAVEIMQYTGLKDMEEKEIYEGDIMLNSMFGDLWVVKFKAGAYIVWNKEIDYAGCLGILYESFKVIGNIYENPELVNGDQYEKYIKPRG